jgi:hypothetical protein
VAGDTYIFIIREQWIIGALVVIYQGSDNSGRNGLLFIVLDADWLAWRRVPSFGVSSSGNDVTTIANITRMKYPYILCI